MWKENDLKYYDSHAASFAADTCSVDFSEIRARFTRNLVPRATLLDFGCGSGCDTKAFLEQGFRVMAVDGSEELCKIADRFIGRGESQIIHLYLNGKAYDAKLKNNRIADKFGNICWMNWDWMRMKLSTAK